MVKLGLGGGRGRGRGRGRRRRGEGKEGGRRGRVVKEGGWDTPFSFPNSLSLVSTQS